MFSASNEQALVYQVLDDVLAGGSLPPTCRGTIFAAVDALRFNADDQQLVRAAEEVSVELHKLEWALQRGDGAAAAGARKSLKKIAANLLNSRISARSDRSDEHYSLQREAINPLIKTNRKLCRRVYLGWRASPSGAR
jgi:hypothetical protein